MLYNFLYKGEKMKLNQLFENQFQCMFYDICDIDFGKKLQKVDINPQNLSSVDLIRLLKCQEICLKLVKDGVGTLIVSKYVFDLPYNILQKKYKDSKGFYFWGCDGLAYFKLVKDGKIQRKIASRGWFNNHTTLSEEQVIGKEPCEYEIHTNHTYKMKAHEFMVFTKKTLLDMFDFYVPFNRNEEIDFDLIEVFASESESDCGYSIQSFQKPEFLQSLIHLSKDYYAETTVPIVIFEDTECFKISTFSQKCVMNKIKSAKHLLGLKLFNAKKDVCIKSNRILKPVKLSFDNFLWEMNHAIKSALLNEIKDVGSGLVIDFRKEGGEFIPATTSLIYIMTHYNQSGISFEFYSLMNNGIQQNKTFLCKVDSFEKTALTEAYDKIVGYLLVKN